MTYRTYLAAGALALGLAAASSAALAQPYGKGGNYVMSPAPRAAQATPAASKPACDCPMMKGAQDMHEMCKSMMRDHAKPSPRDGSPR